MAALDECVDDRDGDFAILAIELLEVAEALEKTVNLRLADSPRLAAQCWPADSLARSARLSIVVRDLAFP